jgi:hypothetical protein
MFGLPRASWRAFFTPPLAGEVAAKRREGGDFLLSLPRPPAPTLPRKGGGSAAVHAATDEGSI